MTTVDGEFLLERVGADRLAEAIREIIIVP